MAVYLQILFVGFYCSIILADGDFKDTPNVVKNIINDHSNRLKDRWGADHRHRLIGRNNGEDVISPRSVSGGMGPMNIFGHGPFGFLVNPNAHKPSDLRSNVPVPNGRNSQASHEGFDTQSRNQGVGMQNDFHDNQQSQQGFGMRGPNQGLQPQANLQNHQVDTGLQGSHEGNSVQIESKNHEQNLQGQLNDPTKPPFIGPKQTDNKLDGNVQGNVNNTSGGVQNNKENFGKQGANQITESNLSTEMKNSVPSKPEQAEKDVKLGNADIGIQKEKSELETSTPIKFPQVTDDSLDAINNQKRLRESYKKFGENKNKTGDKSELLNRFGDDGNNYMYAVNVYPAQALSDSQVTVVPSNSVPLTNVQSQPSQSILTNAPVQDSQSSQIMPVSTVTYQNPQVQGTYSQPNTYLVNVPNPSSQQSSNGNYYVTTPNNIQVVNRPTTQTSNGQYYIANNPNSVQILTPTTGQNIYTLVNIPSNLVSSSNPQNQYYITVPSNNGYQVQNQQTPTYYQVQNQNVPTYYLVPSNTNNNNYVTMNSTPNNNYVTLQTVPNNGNNIVVPSNQVNTAANFVSVPSNQVNTESNVVLAANPNNVVVDATSNGYNPGNVITVSAAPSEVITFPDNNTPILLSFKDKEEESDKSSEKKENSDSKKPKKSEEQHDE